LAFLLCLAGAIDVTAIEDGAEIRALLNNNQIMTAGGSRPGAGRRTGSANKLSTARVQRAIAEGKRMPPENLLLVADNRDSK
jgi:hypothetical protein